jgi:hypothetical protein
MRIIQALASAGLMLTSLVAGAAQPVIDLGAGGKLTPGVYGEVKFGKQKPPLVYPEPKSIVIYTHPVKKPEPIYLHVPPEYAKNWDQHCREYHACDRPTYFVKSREYEPGYVPPKNKAGKNNPAKAGQDKKGDSSRNGSGDGSGDGTGRKKDNAGSPNGGGKGDGSGGGRGGKGDGSGGGGGGGKKNKNSSS